MLTKPIIELKNINKSFHLGRGGSVSVLKDINLAIYPREFVIILGPSGSGKSTLMNTMLGLERPTSGDVFVRGENLTHLHSDDLADFRLRKIGVVYQRPDWVKALNVWENVSLPLAIAKIPRRYREERAYELLEKLDISHRATYTPTELSGGQQQRAIIARALINNPWIVLADEPTGNLDSEAAEHVMKIMKELNEESKRTVIMITHNIEYVHYATRTIYMRDGRVLNDKISL